MLIDRLHVDTVLSLSARYMTFIAVAGSLAGSALMFFLGFTNIIEAYLNLSPTQPKPEGLSAGSAAVISVIEALDRFLIAIVLLYFANGVFALFIKSGAPEKDLPLQSWSSVSSIGQLKQVVAEVIIVVLFVLFLRVALEIYRQPELPATWVQIASVLVLPLSTVMLALALRLVELHPKPAKKEIVDTNDADDEADGGGQPK